MLVHLADYEQFYGPLRLFRFISFRSVGGAATALLIGFVFGPWLIARLRAFKAAQIFRTSAEAGKLAELHDSKKGTPTMGGLMIYVAVVVSTLLWAEWNVYVLVSLLVYTGLTAVGFLDDYRKVTKKTSGGLAGRYKLLGQMLLTGVVFAILHAHPQASVHLREIWVPFLKDPLVTGLPIVLSLGFLFLVLAGSSNAINLTDGVDGLATGCTLTVAMAFGLMAYASGNAKYAAYLLLPFQPGTGELTVICAILCAACLSFLWYNAHPATVFMGDTGSLALGGLVGVIAFLILQPVTLVIVGGIFVLEAGSVIIQVGYFKFTRRTTGDGQRVFLCAPLHHHFEYKGLKETKVVIRFWILSLIFAIAGLATLKLR